MNCRHFLVVILITVPFFLAGQWTLQHPMPVYYDLNSIAHVSDSMYVAVGNCGTIIKSEDGGNTWYIVDYEGDDDLLCVEFPSPGNGWIIGRPDKLCHSEDEGDTWQCVPIEITNLTDLFFLDELYGWLVGRDGLIMKTVDGGETWSSISIGFLYDMETVFFLSRDTGWVAGIDGFILRTYDGGNTWEGSNWGQQRTIRDIYFINGSEGWCAGADGFVSHSINGGVSWSTTQVSSFDSEFNKIFFINPDTVWAFEDGNYPSIIYCYKNGHWVYESQDVFAVRDFVIHDDHSVKAVGRSGEIAFSADLFKTWTSRSHITHSPTFRIFFANEYTGWTLGTDLLKTNDGGNSWDINNAYGYTDFYRGDFIGEDTAFVCTKKGNNSIVIRTVDGGAHWQNVLEINMSYFSFVCIDFVDSQHGWAAGRQSIAYLPGEATGKDYLTHIYRTIDAGVTWTLEEHDSLGQIYDMQFVNPVTGYIIDAVRLFKTTDAGKTWKMLHNNGSHRHMEFVDEVTGLLAGRTPGLYKTSDGGISWDTMHTGFYGEINGMDILDTNFFVCVGDSGYVLITEDGGQRWSKQKVLPDENNLGGVSFINKNEGWVGNWYNPIIMHTTNGGASWTADEIGHNDYYSVKLFPNPSDGRIWITIVDTHSFKKTICFQLFSINGKKVHSQEIRNINASTTFLIDLPQLSAGVYIWRLSSGDVQFSGKIILK